MTGNDAAGRDGVRGPGQGLFLAMVNSDGKSAPALPDPPGITTELHDLRLRSFARTPYDRLFTELGTLDAAERALTSRCDAVYVDSFADYAVDAIRGVTTVPVVGAGEAAIGAASAGGRRFSIVTVWPRSMQFLYEERLARSAGGEHCAGVHFVSPEEELDRVGTRTGVQAQMRRREGGVVERLVQACADALAMDGSDAVLLGCTCMSPVGQQLAERCDVPVLDASAVGQQAALAALQGPGLPSDAAEPAAARSGRAVRLVDALLAGPPEAEPAAADTCSMCVVAADDAPGAAPVTTT